MKKLMTAMAMTAVMALGAGDLSAQQDVVGEASVTIPQVLAITSVGDLTIVEGDFDFTGSTTSQATGSVTIDTRANIVHAVEVDGADLTEVGGGTLALEVEGSDVGWQAVSATPVKVLSGLARGEQTGNTINFRTEADLATHEPGAYTGSITYTVVANY